MAVAPHFDRARDLPENGGGRANLSVEIARILDGRGAAKRLPERDHLAARAFQEALCRGSQ